jgi:hypothetical protein
MAEVWVYKVNDLEVMTFLPIVMPTTVAERFQLPNSTAVPLKHMYNQVSYLRNLRIC